MSDERLLPCPFCGGEAKLIWDVVPEIETLSVVICSVCDQGRYVSSDAQAIAAWNERCEAMDSYTMKKNQRSDGWVSVEDRLPEKGVGVLVECEHQDFGGRLISRLPKVNFLDDYGKWPAEYGNSLQSRITVTHWMPLPTPPKKEGE